MANIADFHLWAMIKDSETPIWLGLGTVHKRQLCVEVPSTSTKRVHCVLILYAGGGWGVTNRSNLKKCEVFLELHQIQSIVYTVYSIIHTDLTLSCL